MFGVRFAPRTRTVVVFTPMASRLVLLRHGATEWSQSGQHTGRTDIPLLEAGRRQAEAVGALLRLYGLTEFAQVLTSPLVRAFDTCTLAGFDGEVDPDLMEWDYGAYEGITTAEIQQNRPGWDLWSDGVPEGETAAEVGRRADRVVERVKAVDGDTLAVAHGHLLRVLAARWLRLPPAAGRLFMLDAGALCILSAEHDRPAVLMWNLVTPPGT
jgi:broad specificity phosphatase PhoE